VPSLVAFGYCKSCACSKFVAIIAMLINNVLFIVSKIILLQRYKFL